MRFPRDTQVLIAEDDYLVGEMIRGLLEEIGYRIVGEAADGREAVEMTRRLQPDVVLMDIKMPNVDGIEATRLIFESCPTPVVMLTAYESSELVERASAVGAGAYLVKPLSAPEIERAITVAAARFDDLMQLRYLNAELQVRNEELDAFAHTVAHDLKDLLARIVGYAGALEENLDELPDDETRSYLRVIAQSGLKMNSVIDALLLLTTVRQTEVDMEQLDKETIVSEAIRRLEILLEERDAQIILPESWPAAWGYGPWVEEVWVNYISNAVKYGGRPPRVELGATVLPQNNVRFWVRDNGAGIPAERHNRLFKPFTRLDRERSEGYGLGLSIARRIVQKLGGQVGVESEIGQGSIFSFTLPGVPPQSNLIDDGSESAREFAIPTNLP